MCAMLSTIAVPASVVQNKQTSAHPWSWLSQWFAVGDIFLCNCKYSALLCLSCLWQMQWYLSPKRVFLSLLHHAGPEPHGALCRAGCTLGQEEGEML